MNFLTVFPQANAMFALQQGDLTSFTDILNNVDVEVGASEARHWINSSTGEEGVGLLEMAVSAGKEKFVEVLLQAGARWVDDFLLLVLLSSLFFYGF